MWIDEKKYRDYKSLISIIPELANDLSIWLTHNNPEVDTDPVYEDRVSSQNSYAYITPTGIQFANPEMTEPAPDPIRDPEGYKHRKDWRCLGAFYEKKWNTKLLPESYRTGIG